ncbi:MAG: ORF6N domain-containing protein [Bacilli bacterium]|nr:ORF6N domain-containing protein [Bacilli bacterium]
MNDVTIKESIKIENLIYNIRGKQVMLDSDLAKLYQCKNGTKSINLAMKRNIDRFPEDFCFQLTEEEYNNLKLQIEASSLKKYYSRFQFETLNNSRTNRGQNIKYMPYVFTEQGVAMLSSILKTEIASKISINIIRAFVSMRKYISEGLIEQKFINELVLRHENDIKILQESFDKLNGKEVKNEIYFNGQIYDSYSKIVDIMYESKNELIIIDGYADKTVLDMISKLEVKVILIVKLKCLLTKLDIEKYNKQYNNLKIIYNDTFHDRYFILDKKIIYHCGTSINHIGNKTFSINKLEDDMVKQSLIEKINNIIL